MRFGFILLLLLPASVFARHKDSVRSADMEAVTVTATRGTGKPLSPVAQITVIPAAMIRNTGSLKLRDVLQEQAGIQVVGSSLVTALKGFPDPFGQGLQLSGMDPSYTAILLDGEPLTGRNAGIIRLERLSAGNVNRIEILRGPASSLYGSEAMAGVVHIITEMPAGEQLDVQLHHATHKSFAGNVGYTNRWKKAGIHFFLNRYSTQGYDLEPEIYGKTHDPTREWQGQLKLTFEPAAALQGLVSLRGYHARQLHDYRIHRDTLAENVAGHTLETDRSVFTQLRWQASPHSVLYLRNFYNRYDNHSDVRVTASGEQFEELSFVQTLVKPEVQYVYNTPFEGRLTGGGGLAAESVEATRYTGGRRLSTLYGFVQYEHRFRQLGFTAGGRADKRTDIAVHLSPRLSLSFTPFKDGRLKLSAATGSGFKAPDFRHMYLGFYNAQIGYSIFGGNILGERLLDMSGSGQLTSGSDISPYTALPNLQPETSWGSQAGFSWTGPKWKMEGSLFRNDVKNLIEVYLLSGVLKTNGQGIYSYRNISNIYTQGFSADLRYSPVRRLTFSAGYQYLEARDKDVLRTLSAGTVYRRDPETNRTSRTEKSDYRGLFNRSPHTASFRILLSDRQTRHNIFGRLTYRSSYGFQDLNGNNIYDDVRESVPGFWLVNLTGNLQLSNLIRLQAGVENLLNYRNPSLQPFLPGRIYFLNLNFSLNNPFSHNNKTDTHAL